MAHFYELSVRRIYGNTTNVFRLQDYAKLNTHCAALVQLVVLTTPVFFDGDPMTYYRGSGSTLTTYSHQ